MIVLDASVALASFFHDERTPMVVAAIAAIGRTRGVVPGHWRLEVANGLQMAVNRKRIDLDFRDRALDELSRLPIEIDGETNLHAWQSTLRLADRYQLTPYDAAYLELAQRQRLPLATLDRRLGDVAIDAGVDRYTVN